MDSVLTWVHVLTNNKENNMALEYLTKNLKFKIEQLSQDELEDQFELYKSLVSKSVRDEIYTELLAQELDRREQEEYEYE
jgi:uncharacterized UBP type Zn finger protein